MSDIYNQLENARIKALNPVSRTEDLSVKDWVRSHTGMDPDIERPGLFPRVDTEIVTPEGQGPRHVVTGVTAPAWVYDIVHGASTIPAYREGVPVGGEDLATLASFYGGSSLGTSAVAERAGKGLGSNVISTMHAYSDDLPKYRKDAFAEAKRLYKAGASDEEVWEKTLWNKKQIKNPKTGVVKDLWTGEIHDYNTAIELKKAMDTAATKWKENDALYLDASNLRAVIDKGNFSDIDAALRKFGTLFKKDISPESVKLAQSNTRGSLTKAWKEALTGGRYDVKDLSTPQGVALSDIFPHPELFDLDPGLKKLRVRVKPMAADELGEYIESESTLVVNKALLKDMDRFMRTVYHELTHGVQGFQGAPRGASPLYVRSLDEYKALRADIHAKVKKILKKSKTLGINNLTPEELRVLNFWNTAMNHSQYAAFANYRNVHGEAMANLSAMRKGFTEAERRAKPFWVQLQEQMAKSAKTGNVLDFYGDPEFLLHLERPPAKVKSLNQLSEKYQ